MASHHACIGPTLRELPTSDGALWGQQWTRIRKATSMCAQNIVYTKNCFLVFVVVVVIVFERRKAGRNGLSPLCTIQLLLARKGLTWLLLCNKFGVSGIFSAG